MPTRLKTHLEKVREQQRATAGPLLSDDRMYDKTVRSADDALGEASRIRKSHRWKKKRAYWIATHPTCANPLHIHDTQTRWTDEVHHIKQLTTHPSLAFTDSNLMSVCSECHAWLSKQERKKK